MPVCCPWEPGLEKDEAKTGGNHKAAHRASVLGIVETRPARLKGFRSPGKKGGYPAQGDVSSSVALPGKCQ